VRYRIEPACRLRANWPGTGLEEETAMKAKGKTTVGRREFLQTIGVGATAAIAAPLVTAARADTESDVEKRKARYKESDHVKAYYRVNRYPS
jgi:hypothetical protein